MGTSLKTVTVMKTRKAVPCIWCGESIEAGTSCTSHIYIEDHKFCDDRFHPECDKACQEFYRQEKCWGEPFSPYEFARGSTLEKNDFRIMREREQPTKDSDMDEIQLYNEYCQEQKEHGIKRLDFTAWQEKMEDSDNGAS